jgi:hypothetical protein
MRQFIQVIDLALLYLVKERGRGGIPVYIFGLIKTMSMAESMPLYFTCTALSSLLKLTHVSMLGLSSLL